MRARRLKSVMEIPWNIITAPAQPKAKASEEVVFAVMKSNEKFALILALCLEAGLPWRARKIC